MEKEENIYKPNAQSSSSMQEQGIVKAVVVVNKDDKKQGRVRVRVPSFHGYKGTSNGLNDEDCPWAEPCLFGCSGFDYGSFIVPPVGSTVWVFFENNDRRKPVYFGGAIPATSKSGKKFNDFIGDSYSMGEWKSNPGELDTPKDVYEGKSLGNPDRGVIFKSQKGHTISYDDTDGEESFTICDRIGQMVKFTCPVSKSKNKGNSHRRYTNLAEKDNQKTSDGVESITIRSGLNEKDPERTFVTVFRNKIQLRCENVKTGFFTEMVMIPEKITIISSGGGSFSRRTMVPKRIYDEVGQTSAEMIPNMMTLKSPMIHENPHLR